DGPGAFDIAIGGLESFSSAPFLTVHDARGALATLRRCLHAEGAHPHGPYVPHVTVGLYAGAWPSAGVAARFGRIPAVPQLRHRVTRVSLLGYVAAEIGGTLFTLAEYELESGRMHWHATPRSAEAVIAQRASAGRQPVASTTVAAGAAR
ncbi:MAG: 2'-5' RNA ligase family protein, partial [Thauera sp.]|nr:2'-5' RNA ligase family protein [Thauera sp.]